MGRILLFEKNAPFRDLLLLYAKFRRLEIYDGFKEKTLCPWNVDWLIVDFSDTPEGKNLLAELITRFHGEKARFLLLVTALLDKDRLKLGALHPMEILEKPFELNELDRRLNLSPVTFTPFVYKVSPGYRPPKFRK